VFKLDLVETVTFAGIVLFIGYRVRQLIPPLARYNVPAAVIGGILTASLILLMRSRSLDVVAFDTTLQAPLMIAFFTTIGFGASLSLLRTGGPQVLLFFIVATLMAVAQNMIGILVALPLGMHPLFGILSGSVTLTGGPATGLAFAPLFEQAGVQGAATIAVASAMVGIISGGLIGGPIGTALIERYRLKSHGTFSAKADTPSAAQVVEEQMTEPRLTAPAGEDKESYLLLKSLVIILVAMWMGSALSSWLVSLGFTLPAYIGAMLVAAVFRNLDDLTRLLGLSQKTIDDIGSVSLSLFIVLALMTLKLWELAGLALPLLVILAAQVILIAAVCVWPLFKLMGNDYDSAVISGGFCGFMLGTTANAMANMEALVERYGPAPRAFLVVPMVGAFFIDFTNAVIITLFLNFWK
jgi:glutamate:Na+ symporter, ESS family